MKTILGEKISSILTRIDSGDALAVEELFPLVYDDLRQQAGRYLNRERKNHTLQATALVNQAYVKLAEQTGLELNDQVHLLAVSARAMRQILVDHARAKRAAKRGGDEYQLAFDENIDSPADKGGTNVLEIEDALRALTALDERKGRVAELKLFGNLTHAQVGKALGIAPKTAESDWYAARAWLRTELKRQ